MVFGKKVAFLIGDGAEIRPLEMGRKGPEMVVTGCNIRAYPAISHCSHLLLKCRMAC